MKVSKADFALHKEILERKRAEARLKRSQQELADFFDNAVMCLCWIAADGHIARVNQAMLDLLRLPREEVEGRALSEFTNVAQAQEMLRRLAAGETFTGHELRLRRGDGTACYVLLSANGLWEGGRFVHARCFLRDITVRKQAEQDLRDQEVRIRSIVETAVDGIVVIDAQGRVESFNPAAERLFGYPAEEIMGRNVRVLLAPPYHEEHAIEDFVRAEMNKLVGTGREIMARRKDGTTFPIELVVSEMNLGGERHFTGIIRDITERKQHEQQLVNSLREKVVLLREVHHRVKNNLQVIISLLNLQAGYVADPRASAMFRESQNRVRCMATIHETLYRADDLTQINFAAYVQNLGANLQRFYGGARALQLKYDVKTVFLGMDTAIACGLILHELVSNCFKHAYPEGMAGEILVSLRDLPDGIYRLTVADYGVGLPADLNVDKADSLGLRLVRALVGQLNGKVEYAKLERGTTVTLDFMDRHGSEVVS